MSVTPDLLDDPKRAVRAARWAEFKIFARRFMRNPLGVVGLAIVVLLLACAAFAPLLATHDPYLPNLADRLAGDEGDANFAAVHRMLQRRFQVASYLLIPRSRYEEALGFLRQHRAINRSHLRGRNPVAYQNDFYRAIFAGARELGWDGERVYRFATEKLALKTAVASLKELGPVQLKALAGFIQREVRTVRASRELAGAATSR